MASTLAAATLAVTISESITINGLNRGSTNSVAIASILNCDTRTHTVSTTEEKLFSMGTTASSGQFNKDKVRYIRVTNKDDTNAVRLVMRNTGNTSANEVIISIDAYCSYIFPVDLNGGTDGTIASKESAFGTPSNDLEDLVDVMAFADAGTVLLEVFIASIA